MFQTLSKQEFLALAAEFPRVVVYRECPSDCISPINAYQQLSEYYSPAVLLESNSQQLSHSRYSHCFLEPALTLSTNEDSEVEFFTRLRACAYDYRGKIVHPLSRLAGSLVGFLTYDAVRLFESIPDRHQDDSLIPDAEFRLFKTALSFDHQTSRLVIATLVEVSDEPELDYREAIEKIQGIYAKIQESTAQSENFSEPCVRDVTPEMSDEEFVALVERAKEYIVAGDAFQIVISREFCVPYSKSAFHLYRALRLVNPSPYMFYIDQGDYQIVGSSPEKLVSVQDRLIESCPLAGTRRRGKTTEEDFALERELASDEKELAEHRMLVDLHRNDVGVVAVADSVRVVKMEKIEKYSKVMHISSTVQGQIREECDAFDALKAAFPAGTLTGAPKIRAMEIIDELEKSRRGIYGGAVVMIDNAGNCESCIAIRMAVVSDGVARVRAGAGVVFDSDPISEARETRQKAQGVIESIFLASGVAS